MDKIKEKIGFPDTQLVSSWGKYPKVEAHVFEPQRPRLMMSSILEDEAIIARGNGRSYGDSSLQKRILSTRYFNRFLEFNPDEKTLYCESGVLLDDIIRLIVPKGCFLPVVPGTRLITIGGAVAANVHGKNHHCAGSIARYIRFLDLIGEDGEKHRCSPTENPDVFAATIGGMGLTGIITAVSLQLIPLTTAYIQQEGQAFGNLETLCDQLLKSDAKYPYTVAWMDGMSKAGRGVLLNGQNCTLESLPQKFKQNPLAVHNNRTLKIPPLPSSQLLNKWVLKAYNTWLYHFKPAHRKASILHYSSFFFPLDNLGQWNRLYGKKGLLQYQFVLPLEHSVAGLAKIWETIQASPCRPFLAVLKAFGNDPTPVAAYSFPMPGLSLALDFKTSPAAFKLLEALDQIVMAHQGRLYLVKDARMSAKTFSLTYPGAALPAGKYQSLQSQRLQL